ncbi:hypothetical protein HC891_17460 [Candidatus Gracilibacteria bacterium]|nr:hypothetical protein [Candidatus Gracilibacteria bacterium]
MGNTGLLGTAAPLIIDLTLLLSIGVILAMTVGAILAWRQRYEAHRWVQTGAVILNAVLVLTVMIGSLLAAEPASEQQLTVADFAMMTGHEIVGAVALIFGIFVTLRGNELVPARLKFSNYKPYMRAAYGLYLVATIIGIGVYWVLYI